MTEDDNYDMSEATLVPNAISDGERFFDPPENSWFLITLVLVGTLFLLWGIRAEMDLFLVFIITPIYIVSIIIPFRFPFRKSEIIDIDGVRTFIFRRSGFSWQILLDAILGSAIPIVLLSFFLTQGIPSSPELNRILMLMSMIIYVLIVPVIPLLGSIKRLNILKTTISAELDDSGSKVKTLNMDVNPLDGFWYKNRENPELIESITSAINDLLVELI